MNFIPALGLVFIVLKLTGFITWSWTWVLAPIWVPILLLLIVSALIAYWED